MTGEVISGINNIYRVRPLDDGIGEGVGEGPDEGGGSRGEPGLTPRPPGTGARGAAAGGELLCRIRGKVLRSADKSHNPLAVGDRVTIERDPGSPGSGWISERRERRSVVLRYNRKSRASQVIAANVDLLVCVSSTREPPFRPRFLDRLLVSASSGGVRPLVFVNKSDLGVDDQTEGRLRDYERIGFAVIRGSARSREGLERLRSELTGRTSVLAGQSGVGKTSLLNALDPGLRLRVGGVSRKYDRGSHTTNFAELLTLDCGARVIDTPGIRELDVRGIPAGELRHYYPEFAEVSASCEYSSCTHTEEQGCAVREAVGAGRIHPDRYEGYLRTLADLVELERHRYG